MGSVHPGLIHELRSLGADQVGGGGVELDQEEHGDVLPGVDPNAVLLPADVTATRVPVWAARLTTAAVAIEDERRAGQKLFLDNWAIRRFPRPRSPDYKTTHRHLSPFELPFTSTGTVARVRLLRQGPFALLCTGTALNAIGSWAAIIAIWGFASSNFHASPTQIALLGLAWSAPGALIGPLAGVPVDRFGPRAVLLASDAVGAGTALAMAAAHSFGMLAALAFGSGLVEAAGLPAGQSLPPRLVDDEDLLQANALLSMADQSATVFGPLLAAAVIAGLEVQAAFYVDAITFVVGAISILPLRLRPLNTPPKRESVWREVRAGLRLAWSTPAVRRTLALAAAAFASWGAFFVLEPLYVRDVLHRSAALLGLFQTAFGIGLLTTTALLPRFGDRVASVRALSVSVAVSGVAAAAYVGTHLIAVAFVGVVAWGVDMAFFLPPMQVLLQRATPAGAHGRILALSSTADGVANVIAIPLTGVCVQVLGVRGSGALVGALAVVAGLAGWVIQRRAEGGLAFGSMPRTTQRGRG